MGIGFSRHNRLAHCIIIPFTNKKDGSKIEEATKDTETEVLSVEIHEDQESSHGSVDSPTQSGDDEWTPQTDLTPKTVKSPKAKPFLCLECKTRFTSKNELIKHMIIHTSEVNEQKSDSAAIKQRSDSAVVEMSGSAIVEQSPSAVIEKSANVVIHDKPKTINKKTSKEVPLSEKRVRQKNSKYANSDFHVSLQGYTPEYMNRLEKKEKVDRKRKIDDIEVDKKERS